MVAGIFAKMATQRDLDEGLKIGSKALVDVEWLDACAHKCIEKINPKHLLKLLCPSHTMGKVVAQDKDVLCVARHISNANGFDIIAIPIRWIRCIKMMGEVN